MKPAREFSALEVVDGDIDDAVFWYRTEGGGNTADRFLSELAACASRIADGPLKYQCYHGTVRRALLRGFPYAMFFVCDDKPNVCVIAVASTLRRPFSWSKRLDTDEPGTT